MSLFPLNGELRYGHYILLPRDLMVPRIDGSFMPQKSMKGQLCASYCFGQNHYIVFHFVFYVKGLRTRARHCTVPGVQN